MLLKLLIVAVFVAFAVAVKTKLNSVYFSRVFSTRDCLTEHIRLATDPEVQCPHQEDDYACHATITGQEIQAVSNLKLETKGYFSGEVVTQLLDLKNFAQFFVRFPRAFQVDQVSVFFPEELLF